MWEFAGGLPKRITKREKINEIRRRGDHGVILQWCLFVYGEGRSSKETIELK